MATDRNLLLDQARANGVAGLIDIPGVPAIQLVLDPLSARRRLAPPWGQTPAGPSTPCWF